eukprot:TRINITY_DN5861_c0_g1_i7.p1 TRINITY_DN5861_c0_g1~~TRINITY_DN5861_c0_g1_i7.p1  ORF type:complete len:552 (+),score=154.79 TRINITY_DN5861_c0_g1_i7:67-1722(+)
MNPNGMNPSIGGSSIRRNLMTAQDIHQLRESFYDMEEKAQKTISSKNKHVQDLQAELQELKDLYEQKSRQAIALSKDISGAKQKLKAYGASSPNDDLLDMIDLHHQMATEQLRSKSQDMIQLESKIAQIETDKYTLRVHMEKYNQAMEEMKSIVMERGFSGSEEKGRTLIELLEKRVDYELRIIREKEETIQRNTTYLGDLKVSLQEKLKQVQSLQADRKGAIDRIREAKEMLCHSRIYEKFRFSAAPKEKGMEKDIISIIESLDQGLMVELSACDDEVNEVRKRLAAVESTVSDRNAEIERLKRDLKQLQDDRESKIREIHGMNEQLQIQGNSVRRKIEQLEAKDRELEEIRRSIQKMEMEIEEKTIEIENSEEDIFRKERQISTLQEQVQISQQEVGEKVLILTALLERMQTAREHFENLDEQIRRITAQLEMVQMNRVTAEDNLRRIREEEEALATRGISTRGIDLDGQATRGAGVEHTYADDELNSLFKTAKRNLQILGEKANISVATLRTKHTIDSVFHEQINVSGTEISIRDKKITSLAEKVFIH